MKRASSQSKAATNGYQPGVTSGYAPGYQPNTPTVKDEHVLIAIAMSPLRAGQRSYRFLSSVKGFGVIASLMTVYCAGLSIESIMISMPSAMRTGDFAGIERTTAGKAQVETLRRQRRFIPKPYVDDGAELGRLNPWPNIQRTILSNYFQWLPMWIRGRVASDYWTVWNAPGTLALAAIFAITIQRFEGLIWRKKSNVDTMKEFYAANAQKMVTADPKAIALANYKAQQHNSQGLGSVVGTFVAVVLLYGLEIAAFAGSFAGAGNWVINTIYAGLNIFGFEVFDRMGADDQA